MSNSNKVLTIAKENNGTVTSAMIQSAGIARQYLKLLVDDGSLEKVSRGVYVLPEVWDDEFFNLQSQFKKGIFSNETAFDISFDRINDFFFDSLMMYSYQTKEIKQNYFAKIIKVLKSFLSWATEKGYNTNREFEKFKAPEHDIDIVFLTFEELMILYEKEFETERLSHVRDFYCMGCFTGLRFSDLEKLHLANISEDHILLSIQTVSLRHS